MPEQLFVASSTPIADSIQSEIVSQLARVPQRTWEAEVTYHDGTVKVQTAIRLDHGRWALVTGVSVEKAKERKASLGAYGKVTVTW